MGRKRVVALRKSQRSAVLKKQQGIPTFNRVRCDRTWYVDGVDYNEELRRRRPGREEQLVCRALEKLAAIEGSRSYRRASVERIIERVGATRARLLDEPYLKVILALGWAPALRDVSDWSPPGKGSAGALQSLVQHLLGPYRVPGFLIDSLMTRNLVPADMARQLRVAQAIASGQSLYKARTRLFDGVPMTRRMCHLLVGTPGDVPLSFAVRRAQVLGHGGDHTLAQELGQGFFRHLRPDEAWWSEVIQWLCQLEGVNLAQVHPVCDYLEHAREQDPDYSIQGRTWRSVCRRMREWHEDVALTRQLKRGRKRFECYEPSGFVGLQWNQEIRKGRKVVEQIPWSVREILDVEDLVAEGRAMSHCVGTYGSAIRSGRSSIWSLTCRKKRHLTIEVDNRTRRVVQVRGRANRLPNAAELPMLRRWAERNGFTFACRGV